jgi:hypothetical protein
MTGRLLVVLIAAFLVATQVFRNAVVSALANVRPAAAERIWPGHPEVVLSVGMTSIATAAGRGKAVSASTIGQILHASAKAPLAAEPFLVRGIQAQLRGKDELAEEAFLSAEWRDGRSLPARYFLADYYLRQGDAGRGVSEIGALARLAPNGVGSLAPYVAAYARDRSSWPQLRSLFRSEPVLEDRALLDLAKDPKNADTILALSSPERRGPDTLWLTALLGGLTTAGQYDKARAVWSAVSRVHLNRAELIYDPAFRDSEAPPPFNWALTSSTVGLAERARGGGLHVMFYGQEDGVLAKQLLILPAGRYRLSAPLAGGAIHAESLRWTLICDSTNAPIASASLVAAGRSWSFDVPANCRGQRLELSGSSPDLPQRSEVTIRRVDLAAERSSG